MPIVKVNDINLYYEVHGKSQAQPLVLVSGFSGDHSAWRSILSNYTDKYQVVIFDNRGIGKTDSPNFPYTTEMMADDTVALVKALQLGPAHFVGLSFGGAIVQNIAYKYPEITKSIVIACFNDKVTIRGKLYAELRHDLIKAGAPQEAIVKMITILCWSEKYLNKPGMLEVLLQQGFYPISLAGYEGQLNALMSFDSSGWVDKIQCPALIIASDDDPFARIEDAERISKIMPHAELYCFKAVGHLPFIEQPKTFNKIVLDFLES